jgi:hypothetical protein
MRVSHHLSAKVLKPAGQVLFIPSQIEPGDVTERLDLAQSNLGRFSLGLALSQPRQKGVWRLALPTSLNSSEEGVDGGIEPTDLLMELSCLAVLVAEASRGGRDRQGVA